MNQKKGGTRSPQIRAQNPRRIASLERSKEDVMREIIEDAKTKITVIEQANQHSQDDA